MWRKLSQIIKLSLQLPGYGDFQADVVTDFTSILVSRRKLSFGMVERVDQYQVEGEEEPRAQAQTLAPHRRNGHSHCRCAHRDSTNCEMVDSDK